MRRAPDRRRREGRPAGIGRPARIGGVPHAAPTVPRRRHRRRARRPRRGRLPALLAARPQAGPLLGRWRPGRRPRALAVRAPLRSRRPGKWTDAAAGIHGDLLDLIRHRTGAPSLRAALDEARAFLALPVSPATGSGDSYDATEAARRLWRQCRAIAGSHAERYLHARGLLQCRFAALRYHPELRYRDGSSVRRFPALVAAVTGNDGAVLGVQRTWLDPRRPAKAGVTNPRKALGGSSVMRSGRCRPGRRPRFARRRRGHRDGPLADYSRAGIGAAAALSAGSLGAFAPSARRRADRHRPGQRSGRRARRRTPRPALRAGRRRRNRSSSPSATTSTTTSSRSARRRCAPGSHRWSASRGARGERSVQ